MWSQLFYDWSRSSAFQNFPEINFRSPARSKVNHEFTPQMLCTSPISLNWPHATTTTTTTTTTATTTTTTTTTTTN